MLKLDQPQMITLSPSPSYAKVLDQYQHHFIALDSQGRVRPMTSSADELGLLLVLLNPPREGEGCMCAYGGVVDVIAGAAIAVGQEVIAYFTGPNASYQGCVIPKPTTGGKLYQVRGRAITAAATMGETSKVLLMHYTN